MHHTPHDALGHSATRKMRHAWHTTLFSGEGDIVIEFELDALALRGDANLEQGPIEGDEIVMWVRELLKKQNAAGRRFTFRLVYQDPSVAPAHMFSRIAFVPSQGRPRVRPIVDSLLAMSETDRVMHEYLDGWEAVMDLSEKLPAIFSEAGPQHFFEARTSGLMGHMDSLLVETTESGSYAVIAPYFLHRRNDHTAGFCISGGESDYEDVRLQFDLHWNNSVPHRRKTLDRRELATYMRTYEQLYESIAQLSEKRFASNLSGGVFDG